MKQNPLTSSTDESNSMRTTIIAASALLTTISAAPQEAHAQVTMVTTRPSTDAIDWGQLNVLPSGEQPIPTPQRFESFEGIRGSIGEKRSPLFVERNFDGNPHYGEDAITTNFAPGDWVIAAGSQIQGSQILISFQQPVRFVGAQLGRNGGAQFIGKIQVFSNNNLLGMFTENGNTTANLDNTAIFLGVMDAEADITDVIYTVTDPAGLSVGILINQVAVSQ
jgi:hypothetical protein